MYTIRDLQEGRVAVEMDEDRKGLETLLQELSSPKYRYTTGTFYYMREDKGFFWSVDEKPEHLPVQSFKLFKQQLMKEKKIIGYKCPKAMYSGTISKNTTWKVSFEDGFKHYLVEGFVFKLPAEIVETWEPVYEPTEEIVKVRYKDGTFDVKITSEGIIVEGNLVDVSSIKGLLNGAIKKDFPILYRNMEQDCTVWQSLFTHVTIGCKQEVVIEDLQKVLNTYNKLSK